YCPDYEIIEWNESNYDFTKNQYMKDALDAKKWGFVPDYARLDIIYQHGGIYLDTDVEIVKSFDDLLDNSGFAGFESPEAVALGLGFGAKPGNSVIKELMQSYELLSFLNDDGAPNLVASPVLNTEALVKLGLQKNGELQTIMECFTIYPAEYFCPKSINDGIIRMTDNTYSIHHYDASWFTDEQQKKKIERWERKQKRAKQKARRAKLKGIFVKVFGQKFYDKLRKR
ncbi:MAG: glycosyl transferase, partial [Ruminococcus sp.]|nr:glycosyl transferase [Ruminococcus sp.]